MRSRAEQQSPLITWIHPTARLHHQDEEAKESSPLASDVKRSHPTVADSIGDELG